jgi:hypothetical protein
MSDLYNIDMTTITDTQTFDEVFKKIKARHYYYCTYNFYNIEDKKRSLIYTFFSLNIDGHKNIPFKNLIKGTQIILVIVPQQGN